MTRTFDFENKVVVITGGAGFLGFHYCKAFAEQGATVVMADLSPQVCEEKAHAISHSDLRGKIIAAPVDLSDETAVIKWATDIRSRFSAIDVLINNAAIKTSGFFAPLETFQLDDWNKTMAVNVTAMFLTVRELGPSMVKRGKGSIINVSSIYGTVGPDQRIYEGSWYEEQGGAINTPLVYSVSKGAILSLTRHLATLWGPKGVRTNTLTPGGVAAGQNDEFKQKYSSRVPLGRMGNPEDMVGAALYLASDFSEYVNGQNLIVDGGWTAW